MKPPLTGCYKRDAIPAFQVKLNLLGMACRRIHKTRRVSLVGQRTKDSTPICDILYFYPSLQAEPASLFLLIKKLPLL